MADIASRSKARKLANARNLAALANDTKWGEFFAAVESLGIPLQIKLLYENEPYAMTRVWVPATNYVDSKYGPELFVFVEWVRARDVEEVSRIAGDVGLDYSLRDAEVTVFGYK
jgi:hypothetical protein